MPRPSEIHANASPDVSRLRHFFGTLSSNDNRVHLLRDDTLIEMFADMSHLTRRYTDEAIHFIKTNKEFLLRSLLILCRISGSNLRNHSWKVRARNLWGYHEEIDWNVGRILDALGNEGLDQSTYVIYTSDNGPWALTQSSFGASDRADAEEHGG